MRRGFNNKGVDRTFTSRGLLLRSCRDSRSKHFRSGFCRRERKRDPGGNLAVQVALSVRRVTLRSKREREIAASMGPSVHTTWGRKLIAQSRNEEDQHRIRGSSDVFATG